MSIRNRFAEALAAGRAAVAVAEQRSIRAFASLDPSVSAEEILLRMKRLRPALAGQRTLLVVGSDSLGLYRIEDVITEYLPLRALDSGTPGPDTLAAELYAARRLRLVCAKWNVETIEALDAATAARLALLRGHNGDIATVVNAPK